MRVIIVGGGLAGLMMGIMLDQAGIDYHILEQASRLRPLGTSISLHPVIRDLMDQLGLLEEMEAMSKPMRGITVLSAKGRRMGRIDTRTNKRRYFFLKMMTISRTRTRLLYVEPLCCCLFLFLSFELCLAFLFLVVFVCMYILFVILICSPFTFCLYFHI